MKKQLKLELTIDLEMDDEIVESQIIKDIESSKNINNVRGCTTINGKSICYSYVFTDRKVKVKSDLEIVKEKINEVKNWYPETSNSYLWDKMENTIKGLELALEVINKYGK